MVVLCIGSACITGICVKWASQYDPEQRSYDPVVLSKTVPVKLPACAVGWGQYNNSFAWLCCSKLERRKKQKFKVWYKKFFKKVGNTGYPVLHPLSCLLPGGGLQAMFLYHLCLSWVSLVAHKPWHQSHAFEDVFWCLPHWIWCFGPFNLNNIHISAKSHTLSSVFRVAQLALDSSKWTSVHLKLEIS